MLLFRAVPVIEDVPLDPDNRVDEFFKGKKDGKACG